MKSDRYGWPTKPTLLGVVVALALLGCSEDKQPAGNAGKVPAADIAAGKAIAERSCKTCHGLDGKGTAPGIPHLAGQPARYLIASLQEYKSGQRLHGALRNIAAHLSEAETRNIAGYYASLPPIMPAENAVSTSVPSVTLAPYISCIAATVYMRTPLNAMVSTMKNAKHINNGGDNSIESPSRHPSVSARRPGVAASRGLESRSPWLHRANTISMPMPPSAIQATFQPHNPARPTTISGPNMVPRFPAEE